MKLEDAYVAWTPSRDAEAARCGEVIVGTKSEIMNEIDVSPRLRMWIGVCAGIDARASDWQKIAMMFINQNTLIMRDGIDPQKAHTAFLRIDEYRQRISEDTPGAE